MRSSGLLDEARRRIPPIYAIAVPARDEESRIETCLAACKAAMERCAESGLIVLLVNNSRDRTAQRAAAWAARTGAPLVLRQVRFAKEVAHAGSARRAALDSARRQIATVGYLLTTDADSEPDEEWVRANLEILMTGNAALVCGAVALDPLEFAELPQWATEKGELEERYRRTALQLASLLDPDPLNAWPFHGQASGASLAMSAAAYDRIGGAPIVPCGEDRALVGRFIDHDLPVLYSDAARVVTSCRLQGRAPGGMADTIAARLAGGEHLCDESLEPAQAVWFRASLRSRLRHTLRNGCQRADALSEAGLSENDNRMAFTNFGALWAYVEAASPRLARRRMLWAEMAAELPRLEELRDEAELRKSIAAAAEKSA